MVFREKQGWWNIFLVCEDPRARNANHARIRGYRTKGPIATWQLGLKRASSLFHSACCPTSVICLDSPPYDSTYALSTSPPSFELSKRNSRESSWETEGKKEGNFSLPSGIKVFDQDSWFLLFNIFLSLSLSLLNLKRNTTDRSINFNNNSLGKTVVRKI